jgi:uncharacterized membrane protein YcfT
MVARLLKNVPWVIVWLGAAALEIAHIQTGSILIDEFASRFVYFYSGYILARFVFALADEAAGDRATALTGLALWAVLNWFLVFHGWADLPFVSLGLGFAGALAIVTTANLLLPTPVARIFRWLGEHSIVVYLAFFLPMAASRAALLKSGLIIDVGTISLLVTAIGIAGPVVLYAFVRWTGFGAFLFERPAWARIDGRSRRPAEVMVPAE